MPGSFHWALFLAGLGCSVALAAAPSAEPVAVRQPAIVVSPDTTVITAPLNADGTPDYLAALNARMARGVTMENNAAIPLLRALGPGAIFEAAARPGVFAGLSMAPLPESGSYFTDFARFARDYREPGTALKATKPLDYEALSKIEDSTTKVPWRGRDYPMVSAWIETNEKPLAEFIAASERPRYYIPMVSTRHQPCMADALGSLSLGRQNSIARCVISRALRRAGDGDAAGARSDLLAVHRFAQLIGQCPLLIGGLVAINTDGRAFSAEQAILYSGKLSGAQTRSLLEGLGRLPEVSARRMEYMETEHLFTLDSTIAIMHGRSDVLLSCAGVIPTPGTTMGKTSIRETDWNMLLRTVNRRFDSQAAVFREPIARKRAALYADFRRQDAAVGLPESALDAVVQKATTAPVESFDEIQKRAVEQWRTFLTCRANETIPAYSARMTALFVQPDKAIQRALILFDRAATRQRLTVLDAALALYHAEHNTYPASLDAVGTATYLRALPLDPFSGKSFIYHGTSNGYLLYSVGDNGIDDGGQQTSDDIVVRAP